MVRYIGNREADGLVIGQNAADLIGFYGESPVAQQTVTAITDASGGTANAATGLVTITAAFNQTIIANGFATVADGVNRIRAALATVGIFA